ncbi:hypothetical protein BB560_001278 [Smittium megazygosporum]|uniref:Acetolactate synthase n=1 Tax=Smittium megazygosporum TaxID=133381 RepID=A0A2T9ZI13_9FUNG|nr:hypothetical protein BB560_001278 [Smittium megazygosporum]
MTNPDSKYVGLTGAEIVRDMIIDHGVEQVFGYPGGAINPVFDAIYGEKRFNFVLPRHEQNGGHMAEGYYMACGKPAVLIVTSGPGTTNTVTALSDAYSDGIPIIMIAGQVPTKDFKTAAFQEIDTDAITGPITKWTTTVTDVADLPTVINKAFDIALSGRPGPVVISLPEDVSLSVLTTIKDHSPVPSAKNLENSLLPMDAREAIEKAANLLNNAERPILLAGKGVLSGPDGPKLLKEIAELADVPVATTLLGLGAFDELDPKSLHMVGMYGGFHSNRAVQVADLIIALGARLDERVTSTASLFAAGAQDAAKHGKGGIVQFEINPANINKRVQVDVAVLGDVVKGMQFLLKKLKKNEHKDWLAQCARYKQEYPFYYETLDVDQDKLRGPAVLMELDRQLERIKDKVIITTGVGQHQMWACQLMKWRFPHTLISSGGQGTMGFGLPAAIGAKLANPEKMVIDIDGDGSLGMSVMEMATAVQFKIPIKILLLENHFLGLIKESDDLSQHSHYSHCELVNPNFVDLAKSMHFKAIRSTSKSTIKQAIEEFLEEDGPVLLDVVCDPNTWLFPITIKNKALDDMIHKLDIKNEKIVKIDSK